jgi:glycosyltransferase involved in cell wall biosynthesis
LQESVQSGVTGFLVPHGDAAALAQRIEQLLSDSALYASFRRAALDWAHSFTWERAATETLALLEEARSRGPAPA